MLVLLVLCLVPLRTLVKFIKTCTFRQIDLENTQNSLKLFLYQSGRLKVPLLDLYYFFTNTFLVLLKCSH
jgi:hypothetical protein